MRFFDVQVSHCHFLILVDCFYVIDRWMELTLLVINTDIGYLFVG